MNKLTWLLLIFAIVGMVVIFTMGSPLPHTEQPKTEAIEAPQVVRELTVFNYSRATSTIFLAATPDKLDDLRGSECILGIAEIGNHIEVDVNRLCDFDEVLAWVEAQGSE